MSVSEDADAKLICDNITEFRVIPSQVWIRFEDKEEYEKKMGELMEDIQDSDGNDRIVIYLKKENAKKEMPASWNICAERGLIEKLKKRFGDKNVAVVS